MHIKSREDESKQIDAILNGTDLYAVLAATKNLNGNQELNVFVGSKPYKKADVVQQLAYLKTGADTIFKFTSEIAEDGAQIGNDDKSVDVAKVKNLKYGASAILHVVSKITEIKVSPDNPTLKTVIMETKTALEEMLPSADALATKIGAPETVTQLLAKKKLLRS